MNTPHLDLDLLIPSQAQKHITVNEALLRIDSLVHISVGSRTESQPPETTADGERWLIAPNAEGPWQGREGQIAYYANELWHFFAPGQGTIIWIQDEQLLQIYDGSSWQPLKDMIDQLPRLGINTGADTVNKLAVKSDAALFSHDDVTPGSGDMRLTVNKAAPASDASLTLQTNWQTHAQMGLTGDNNLHVKVSPDGNNFHESLYFNRSDGSVCLPDQQKIVFNTTLTNNQPASASIRHNGPNWEFIKAGSDTSLSEGGLMRITPVGGQNSGNPFWQGVQFASSSVRENGTNRYPMFSFYWSYTNKDDPDDLRFNIKPGNAGGLKTRLSLMTQSGGEIWLNGGNVKVGPESDIPTVKLDVDGAIKPKSYSASSLPSASGFGAGAIIYVHDAAGGAISAFSDGADWRRMDDRSVIAA